MMQSKISKQKAHGVKSEGPVWSHATWFIPLAKSYHKSEMFSTSEAPAFSCPEFLLESVHRHLLL